MKARFPSKPTATATAAAALPSGAADIALDATDLCILAILQRNCKRPLAEIGRQVGLSAPAVMERVHKLEGAGVIRSYRAHLNARALGIDVTAFVGVSTGHVAATEEVEREIAVLPEVLECHHVTGAHTLMLKVKTRDTSSLENLIGRIRAVEGVTGTETGVVLSTRIEGGELALDVESAPPPRRGRRPAARRPQGQLGSAR